MNLINRHDVMLVTGASGAIGFELAAQAAYTFNEQTTFGVNVFYTPNILNTGADGTYASGTLGRA